MDTQTPRLGRWTARAGTIPEMPSSDFSIVRLGSVQSSGRLQKQGPHGARASQPCPRPPACLQATNPTQLLRSYSRSLGAWASAELNSIHGLRIFSAWPSPLHASHRRSYVEGATTTRATGQDAVIPKKQTLCFPRAPKFEEQVPKQIHPSRLHELLAPHRATSAQSKCSAAKSPSPGRPSPAPSPPEAGAAQHKNGRLQWGLFHRFDWGGRHASDSKRSQQASGPCFAGPAHFRRRQRGHLDEQQTTSRGQTSAQADTAPNSLSPHFSRHGARCCGLERLCRPHPSRTHFPHAGDT